MDWCIDWCIDWGMAGRQVLRQGVELGFPEAAIGLDPGGGILHRLRRQAAAVDAAVDFAAEQPGGFEDAQVLGDGGERNVEGRCEFGDGGFAEGQAHEDSAAGGISEGPEGRVEGSIGGGRRIVNHMV